MRNVASDVARMRLQPPMLSSQSGSLLEQSCVLGLY
jgi:hypothetical protein